MFDNRSEVECYASFRMLRVQLRYKEGLVESHVFPTRSRKDRALEPAQASLGYGEHGLNHLRPCRINLGKAGKGIDYCSIIPNPTPSPSVAGRFGACPRKKVGPLPPRG